mgnify:CR=1
ALRPLHPFRGASTCTNQPKPGCGCLFSIAFWRKPGAWLTVTSNDRYARGVSKSSEAHYSTIIGVQLTVQAPCSLLLIKAKTPNRCFSGVSKAVI